MTHQLQPAPLIFGNRQISTSTARRYLNPGQSTGNAGTNSVGLGVFKSRKVRRLRLRVRNGRGNGTDVTYIVRVNGQDNLHLRITKASTWTGTETLVLTLAQTVKIPADAFIEVVADKAANIGQSPLDITVELELL